jgi:hypothetical protein
MRSLISLTALLAAVLSLSLSAPPKARACGGLFCDASQPVNQAAERIIFSENGDGTVTAVIEIKYEGPSERFSWVLPVPGVPEVGVSSVQAFDRLQQQTNPRYQLNRSFACDLRMGANGGGFDAPTAAEPDRNDSGVIVVDSGSVGPFDYEVISVDPELPDPADAAVMWLEDNGYDVTTLGPEVLGPYLADGLNLIAFRLNKDSDTGSIRPIRISYDAEQPFIPIRPTAVAANEDMGILVWVISAERAIPSNYKALELNEALIDWFNPNDTYNDVVTAAANEAGGQGFVTELAGDSTQLESVVLQGWERDEWARISSTTYADGLELLREARSTFAGWDGLDDALREAVTLPDGVSFGDFLLCSACYSDEAGFALDQGALLESIFELVVKPMFDTDELLQSRPYVTRLYTTMSADEMTVDPAFDFNSELGDVDNVHIAEMTIACDDTFSVQLPQGDVVYGAQNGVWPMALGEDQPAARLIMQLAPQGEGEVVVDNSELIAGLIDAARPDEGDIFDLDPPGSGGGTAGGAAGSGGAGGDGDGDGDGVSPDEGDPAGDGTAALGDGGDDADCTCRAPGGATRPSRTTPLLLALGLLLLRRRRRG